VKYQLTDEATRDVEEILINRGQIIITSNIRSNYDLTTIILKIVSILGGRSVTVKLAVLAGVGGVF